LKKKKRIIRGRRCNSEGEKGRGKMLEMKISGGESLRGVKFKTLIKQAIREKEKPCWRSL